MMCVCCTVLKQTESGKGNQLCDVFFFLQQSLVLSLVNKKL